MATDKDSPINSLSGSLAELDIILDLVCLQSRSIKRYDRDSHRNQILYRLYYHAMYRIPQAELADNLQLAVSQVQTITKELKADGFVKREPGAPRGGFYITLTDKGIQEVRRLISQRVEDVFGIIGDLIIKNDGNPGQIVQFTERLRMELIRKIS